MRERSPNRRLPSGFVPGTGYRFCPRMLAVWLPNFRIERCGWNLRDHVILVAEAAQAVRVLAGSPSTIKLGIRPGMTLASARALSPEVAVEWAEADGERTDLKALSRQLGRISPRVDALPPDAIGATLERWPRDPERAQWAQEREQAAIHRVSERLHELGHSARIVVADDLLAARAIAVWSGAQEAFPRWLAPGGLRSALAPLPLAALGLPLAAQESFDALGVRTVQAFADLPPAAVRSRFGPEAGRAHARACGFFRAEPLPLLPSHPAFWRHEDLPFPADSVEALGFVVHRLTASLTEELEERQMATTEVELLLLIEEGRTRPLRFRTGRPTRSASSLSRLLRRRLERVRLDGPVCGVTMSFPKVQSYGGEQPHWGLGATAEEGVSELCARLADHLGTRAVSCPSEKRRWRPEGAWTAQPFFAANPGRVAANSGRVAANSGRPDPRAGDPVWAHEKWRSQLPTARPVLLLGEPRPIEVEPAHGRPRRVCIEGRWHKVVQIAALEALSGEWWADPFERLYLALGLADGRWAWVYRSYGHIFLHGWFDQGGPVLESPA